MNLRVLVAVAVIIGSIACTTKLDSRSANGDLKPRDSPLQVGEMAPDFTIENQNNQKITLSSARGSRPTVLVFYRGNW